jgi:pimeloyl-ACP methyl ester carboxylesterase
MVTRSRTLEHRRVERPDDTTIHYTASGPPDGPAQVLIHGWACNRGDFDAITGYLPDDLRVLAVDLAEHGDSRSARADWSIQEFARDVVAVLDAESVAAAHVAGHSLGGAVAVEVARLAPDRVTRVLALDALHYTFLFGALDDAAAEGFVATVREDFTGLVRSMVEAGSPEGTDEALKDTYYAKMVAVRQPAGTGAFEGLVRWDMEEALAAISAPVTVYAGRPLLTPEAVAHLDGRVEQVVPIDLGSHHFGAEAPEGTARLLADAVGR